MKQKTINKNLLFTCNKCKRYNICVSTSDRRVKLTFGLLKDIIETECLICKKNTKYTIEFQLETESD